MMGTQMSLRTTLKLSKVRRLELSTVIVSRSIVYSLSIIFFITDRYYYIDWQKFSLIAVSDIRLQCRVIIECYASSFLGYKEAVKNAYNRAWGPIFSMGKYLNYEGNTVGNVNRLFFLNIC